MRGYEGLATAILSQLPRANSGLRHLRLDGNDSFTETVFEELSQFLGSTSRLDHLELWYMGFYNPDDLENVLLGLRHLSIDTGVTTIFASKLTFAEFQFADEGLSPLAAFLKTRISHHGAMTCQSALKELRFEPRSHGLGRFMSRQLASALLMARQRMTGSDAGTKLVPTVGSQVQSISLVRVHRIFLDRLGRNAHRVRLESLQLADVSKAVSTALGKCLTNLYCLKVLKLSGVAAGGLHYILRGLRRNGTLNSVEITNEGGDTTLSAAQLRLVEAYCERNRALGEFLDQETDRAWYMFPYLLKVAKQAPMTTVTNLVRGLLTYEDRGNVMKAPA
jgi:hypothetical protein